MSPNLTMLASIVACFAALLVLVWLDAKYLPLPGSSDRLPFLQVGRCVACLTVVFAHNSYCFNGHPVNAAVLKVTPATPAHEWGWFAQTIAQGGVGVMIFFLISGYVISLSLQKTGPGAFVIRRFFRIYPAYIACFIVVVAHYWIYKQWAQRSDWWFGGTAIHSVIGEITLFGDLLDPTVRSGDIKMQIAWTLMIEVKFYLLCALFAKTRLLNLRGIAIAAVGALAAWWLAVGVRSGAGATLGAYPEIAGAVAHLLSYMVYMFIGSCFYLRDQGTIGTRALVLLTVALLAVHMLTCVRDKGYYFIPIGGLLIFTFLYAVRMKIGRLANAVADISYPLYVVHIVCYAVCSFLFLKFGLTNAWYGVAFSMGYAMTLALAVRLWIEVPLQRLGTKIARQLRAAEGSQPE